MPIARTAPILVIGGTGFIGQSLVERAHLAVDNELPHATDAVVVLPDRRRRVRLDDGEPTLSAGSLA